MFIRKAILPAAVASLAVSLTGCLDSGSDATAGSPGALAASTAAQTWSSVCGSCGSRVAFSNVQNPANYYGWTLDSGYTPKPSGGYAVRRITSAFGNSIFPGGLVDLDLLGNSTLFGVSDAGGVFKNDYPFDVNNPWAQISTPASARRVGVGTNKVWILTTETVTGGYKLYYLGTGNTWSNVPAGLTEIDVDNNGDVWGVGNGGQVYRLPGGNPLVAWEQKYSGGDALNVACGNGKIYIMVTTTAAGGYRIKEWNGTAFSYIPGGVQDIMVDVGGRLWAADTGRNVYYYTP